MVFLVLYLITVVFSFLVLLREYRNTEYVFKTKEKIAGLIVVPLIPVLNVVVAILHL